MNNLKIKNVKFLGDTLVAAQDKDNNIWAGISYFCKALGLNKNEKDRQIKNIQTDETLKRGCVKFDAGVFDANNEAIALKFVMNGYIALTAFTDGLWKMGFNED